MTVEFGARLHRSRRISKILLVFALGGIPLIFGAACASLNPCAPYQGSVLIPVGQEGECAVQASPSSILDKVFNRIKKGLEEEGVELNKVAQSREGPSFGKRHGGA